jgi:hypothetical protein
MPVLGTAEQALGVEDTMGGRSEREDSWFSWRVTVQGFVCDGSHFLVTVMRWPFVAAKDGGTRQIPAGQSDVRVECGEKLQGPAVTFLSVTLTAAFDFFV